MLQMFKDRRGIALAFPLLFLILLSCCALVLDMGRAHMVRAKLQTIADASALAGASTAEVNVQSEYELIDNNGEPELQETSSRADVKITDPAKAHAAALKAGLANTSDDFWDNVMGRYEEQIEGHQLSEAETGWSGVVSGVKSYTTETRVKLRPGFLAFLGMKGVTVHTGGTGEAFSEKSNK